MPLPLTHIPDRGFIPFIDAPVCTDLSALDADVAVLGVPYAIPYVMDQSAVFAGPTHLRATSMRFRRALVHGWNFDFNAELGAVRIVDCGDVPGDPMDHRGNVDRATEAVRAILSRGAVPVVFGGDDAVPIPVLRAYRDSDPVVVVQIDQHLDFKDQVNGVREGYSSPMRRASEMGWVSQIVQIGLHGMGSALASDVQDARAAGNVLITERQVHEQGVEWVLEQTPPGGRYFITIDVDGLDSTILPACSHPEPGGLTFHEAVDLLAGLATRGRIVGMDVVEFVADHDLNGLAGRTVGRLVLAAVNAMVRAGQFGG